MPKPIAMEYSMCIMATESISTAYFRNLSYQYYQHHSPSNIWGKTLILLQRLSNTNITASQIVAVVTVMICKYLNQSSWNLVCICTWAHLNGAIHKSLPSKLPILQSLKFLRQNFNAAWTPAPIFMQLCMCTPCHWGHLNGLYHNSLSSVTSML
jgi:hypothetical protein